MQTLRPKTCCPCFIFVSKLQVRKLIHFLIQRVFWVIFIANAISMLAHLYTFVPFFLQNNSITWQLLECKLYVNSCSLLCLSERASLPSAALVPLVGPCALSCMSKHMSLFIHSLDFSSLISVFKTLSNTQLLYFFCVSFLFLLSPLCGKLRIQSQKLLSIKMIGKYISFSFEWFIMGSWRMGKYLFTWHDTANCFILI